MNLWGSNNHHPISQMRKLRHREAKSLIHGHAICKWDLDSGSLVSEPKLFTFQYTTDQELPSNDKWSEEYIRENLTQTEGKSLKGVPAKLRLEEDKEGGR